MKKDNNNRAENAGLISVIIPVWNSQRYLSRCLEGVLAQTFKNFEVICVNDGSTDNSGEILSHYARKDKRVKIINQINRGQAAARSVGLKAARGGYIYFLDSDDFIHPQLLEIAYHFITKHNANWLTFRYRKGFAKDLPLYKNIEDIPYKITSEPLFLLAKNFTYKMTYYLWTRLYERDLIQDIEFLSGNSFEDDPFITAVCAKRPKTVLLNEVLHCYSDNKDGVSNTEKKRVLPKHIEDYHKGLVYIRERYKNAPKKEFDFVAGEIAAKKLRIQYNKIKKSDKQKQAELWKVFTDELIDLDKKDFVRFSLNPRKLWYWLKYRKLIKAGGKK
jgi:glycosyltransferase involved in cell wall biosynthesis